MLRDPGLGRVQRWLQAVILHPGADREAVLAAQAEIPSTPADVLVSPSRTLNSIDRIGIYRGMYHSRLREALEVDYPVLRYVLGEKRFRRLIEGYVRAFPSRSYTLNRLGDHLPDHILSVPRLRHRRFLHDLARFELAMTEVFDAEQAESLSAAEINSTPAHAWPEIRLTPIPALRLITLRYPVHEFHQSMKDDAALPPIRIRKTSLAIYRRDYALRRLVLTPAGFGILAALCAGKNLREALSSPLLTRAKMDGSSLRDWFREWVAEGLFRTTNPCR